MASSPINEVLLQGSRGGGKSIADSTLVLTDRGWIRADKVTMEDQLVAEDGSYTRLLGIYPQPLQQMYEVSFVDGAKVVVSGDHKWKVNRKRYRKAWDVFSTKQLFLMDNMEKWYIPYMGGAHGGKEWKSNCDPYVIGLIAGDGSIYRNHDKVVVTSQDIDIFDYLEGIDGWAVSYTKKSGFRSYALAEKSKKYAAIMHEAGTGELKCVPSNILEYDAQTRLACLQGLMDTDGSIDKQGACSFTSISPTLAQQVHDLVWSLGGRAAIRNKWYFPKGSTIEELGYRVHVNHYGKFNPFRMERKAERVVNTSPSWTRRKFDYILPLEKFVPHRCFAVEHSSHCYIIQDYIVTHNTDCLLMSFAMHTGRGYGAAWRGILFRQTYKQLGDVISKTKQWFPQIFPRARWNGTEHSWTFPDGEVLLLRQFIRESNYWDYHGHSYSWIGWEELCNWAHDGGYRRMFSCNRSTVPGMPRMVRATTNPYGPGHNWVKARFMPQQMNMKVRRGLIDAMSGLEEPPRLSIFSRLEENKILLEADPDYINKIAASARSKAELKAWLEGSWDIVAGGMFDDVWNPEYNVIPVFAIPSNWRVDRSFDWGSSKPYSVGWWAIANGEDVRLPDGRFRSTIKGDIFRIGELYGWNGRPNEGTKLLASEITEEIVKQELRWGWRNPQYPNWCRVKTGIADSNIFNAENGNCVATDMKMKVRMDDGIVYKGVEWMPADKSPGSRITGWDQMRRMMKNAHPSNLGPRERPGLFVFDRCEHFLRTVPVLPRDEKDPDDVDTEAEDHIADETRYRVRYTGINVSSGRTIGMH